MVYMKEFDRLARYAMADIVLHVDNMEAYLNVLSLLLQSKLAVIDFYDFHHLVYTAVIFKSKEKSLEDSLKRKAASSSHHYTHGFRSHPMQRQQQ